MEAKEIIQDLVAAENKNLATLVVKKRVHACRAATFREALATLNGDNLPSSLAAKAQIQSKIADEQIAERKIDLKIADAETRKAALEETASIFKPVVTKASPVKMPERLQDFDYTHKDLREGSDIYRVREFLRQKGKPTGLGEIVIELFGSSEVADIKKGKYASLRGTLMGYAKQGRVFTVKSKSPHVIGLIEFEKPKLTGDIFSRL